MKKLWLVGLLFAAGCASSYEPVVDMKEVDQAQYQQDLEECRAYADKVDVAGSVATDTIVGAAAGAAVGAALGASVGDFAGSGAALGVTAGGATGAGYGTRNSLRTQKKIIRKCLRGRGYKVLD
jgi:outer membrane lipoprotein SlyB